MIDVLEYSVSYASLEIDELVQKHKHNFQTHTLITAYYCPSTQR